MDWWRKWDSYINEASEEHPGKPDGSLKPNLLLENDITIVPESVWNIFTSFYGSMHNDTFVFQRHAIEAPKCVEIEIYPPHYSFYLDKNNEKVFLFDKTFSKVQKIHDLKLTVSQYLELESGLNIIFFIENEKGDYEELDDDTVSIEEASLERDKVIFVRVESRNGTMGNPLISNNHTHSYQSSPIDSSLVPGVCGLHNLGNTCFMNSAVQCMSNVPALTSYFLSGAWTSEINMTNPLGSQGRIVNAYVSLLKHLWSGNHSYAVPRVFKTEIGRIARQFSGYAQHDTHELLVFLLDGLHEDLNRIKSKPYIEVKDSDGRSDQEVSIESWNYYKSRNDSIIVDLFHGQLKSTVICPNCSRKSITFDPFASLILPINEIKKYHIIVNVWPWLRNAGAKSSMLQVEVVLYKSAFSEQGVLDALRNERKCAPNCEYYAPRTLVECVNARSFYVVYELMVGTFMQVTWEDSKMHTFNVPLFITLLPNTTGDEISPDLEVCISAKRVVNLILDRLAAIGLVSNNYNGDNQSPNVQLSRARLFDLLKGRLSLMDKLAKRHPLDDADDDNGQEGEGREDEEEEDGMYLLYSNLPDYKIVVNIDHVASLSQAFVDCWSTMPRHSFVQADRIDLLDCFEKFTDIEVLGSNDLWYCNRCKSEKRATKKFDLWKLPDVLVIQLKRFRSMLRFHDKIDSFIDYPVTGLDLTSKVVGLTGGEKCIYDLVAVSNHMGFLGGGHYTAYCLNSHTNRWYMFNDSSTHEVDVSNVVSKEAYVLVYVRRKCRLMNNQNMKMSTLDQNGYSNCANYQDQDLMDIE